MHKLKLKIVFQFLNKICHCVGVHMCKMVIGDAVATAAIPPAIGQRPT